MIAGIFNQETLPWQSLQISMKYVHLPEDFFSYELTSNVL